VPAADLLRIDTEFFHEGAALRAYSLVMIFGIALSRSSSSSLAFFSSSSFFLSFFFSFIGIALNGFSIF